MPRAIWKGSISFGLVSIPIALYPATRQEELKFRLLRKSDLSPVNYKSVAEKDGKEVSWDQIVKGVRVREAANKGARRLRAEHKQPAKKAASRTASCNLRHNIGLTRKINIDHAR
jgi:hypothetical protein